MKTKTHRCLLSLNLLWLFAVSVYKCHLFVLVSLTSILSSLSLSLSHIHTHTHTTIDMTILIFASVILTLIATLVFSIHLLISSPSTLRNISAKLRKLIVTPLRRHLSIPRRITCLISFYKNRHRLLTWYVDLLSESKTQTIVLHRVGATRTIITANPLNVEYILKTNFSNFPKGKPFTELLGDFLGQGIFNSDGDTWRMQRKLASHEFTARSLRDFLVTVLEDEVRNRMVPILSEAAAESRSSDRSGIVFDMQDLLRRFAFDTICRVSLGLDPNCLDLSKPPPPLVAAFDRASEISARRGAAPVMAAWKVKRALDVGTERELREAVSVVHACVDDMIKNKKMMCSKNDNKHESIITAINNNNNGCNSNGDLLSRIMEAGLSDEMVRDMVISFLLAGRDTTSAALTWLFWLLTWHPEAEKRLVKEILSFEKLGFEELMEMNYLKACLCESMRLYPPVVWDSKHAATDDVLPDGTQVCRGDRVTYFQYGMGRMAELWGEDRFEFKPDRWFDGMGVIKHVSPFKFPVFQAGPRVCLGKEMAFMQMKYVVASILSRFELVPVSEERPVFVPMLTAYMAGGFKVRVRSRGPC